MNDLCRSRHQHTFHRLNEKNVIFFSGRVLTRILRIDILKERRNRFIYPYFFSVLKDGVWSEWSLFAVTKTEQESWIDFREGG